MNGTDTAAFGPFVASCAKLTDMPLDEPRLAVVAAVMTRIADFAADVRAFPLSDDVEIAGVFTP